MVEKDRRTVTIQFKRVQMTRPESKEFEPPDGFAKFSNVNAMMMEKLGGGKK